MSRGRLHDVSQRLRPELPVWPGDGRFECAVTAAVAAGSSVTLHRLSMSTQSGTHAECSRHVRDDAVPLDGLELEAFVGECELRDASHARGRVTTADVLARLPTRVERVLLRTFSHPAWDRWPEDFTALEPALIDALAARGCRLIGTDAPSVDPATCKALHSHHAAHRAGMAILEGLVLDALPEGRYELIALPLPIAGVEATPVRAVLREVE
ncbi:MAG: cyclase family protein [Gammaproteobacteria bacterium]|nr:cyclase family protein [Gammaproteobacteria bacterium]